MVASGRESGMPAPKSEEFRRRAVELARLREKPIATIAARLRPSCRVFGVRFGAEKDGVVIVARCVSWGCRAVAATWLGAMSVIFAGQAIGQGVSMASALLMAGGAVSALLAVRAARAGVILTETAVVCRQLFVTRTIPLRDLRTVQMVEFSGFFIAGFLRSVAVLRQDGVRHRVALASGRPDRIRRCVREFKSALPRTDVSGTTSS